MGSRYNARMSRTAAEILDEARQLPLTEQDWIAQELLNNQNGENDAAWKAEVERRVAEVDAGTAVTYSWEEVKARLRERLSK